MTHSEAQTLNPMEIRRKFAQYFACVVRCFTINVHWTIVELLTSIPLCKFSSRAKRSTLIFTRTFQNTNAQFSTDAREANIYVELSDVYVCVCVSFLCGFCGVRAICDASADDVYS